MVEVDSNDIAGRTPLSYAAKAKCRGPRILEALIKTGKLWEDSILNVEPPFATGKVDIMSKDKNGRTSLSYAEGAEREDLRKLLMDDLQSSGSTIEVSEYS
ncbi:hypothetical protein F9C07_2108716 [Aspergillus flavus]|uniref:Ankyrin repeat-containing domain protein n=1 Tax=Aspergillus flavus (strain ATCC 200026 / FGSC A1120 / IAM 13836 / NRRL 3357 / JCM 12722 / SRRC 167) TaxID=332952 RepID=A0A7U2MJL1_ASPFN|nr:hypothetical protein F9C07_2108716 [Aspergillus flavus]